MKLFLDPATNNDERQAVNPHSGQPIAPVD